MLLAATPARSQEWVFKEKMGAGSLGDALATQFKTFFPGCGIKWPLRRACPKYFNILPCELASIPPEFQSFPLSERAISVSQFSSEALVFSFKTPLFSDWVKNKGETSRYFTTIDRNVSWALPPHSPPVKSDCVATAAFAYKLQLLTATEAAQVLKVAPLRFEAVQRSFRSNLAYMLGDHDPPPVEQTSLFFEIWGSYEQGRIHPNSSYISEFRAIEIKKDGTIQIPPVGRDILLPVRTESSELILVGTPKYAILPTWEELSRRMSNFTLQRAHSDSKEEHLAIGLPLTIQYTMGKMPEYLCMGAPWRIDDFPPGTQLIKTRFEEDSCRFSIRYTLQENADPNVPIQYKFHLARSSESGGPDLRFLVRERLQPTKEPLLTFDRAEAGGDKLLAGSTLPTRAVWRLVALLSHATVQVDLTQKPKAVCTVTCNNRPVSNLACDAVWDAGAYRIEASRPLMESKETLAFDLPTSCTFSATLQLKTSKGIADRTVTSSSSFKSPSIVPHTIPMPSEPGSIVVVPDK
ncbi:MAG TPA: hypothetical protein VF815_31365 [Myxococcaceae bacterium]|jgi:hypothetical protein